MSVSIKHFHITDTYSAFYVLLDKQACKYKISFINKLDSLIC